ncbi:hypothetical protein K3495_g10119 [Podosphaera aphanis]|nr:hypothetical protein K3495_g10119 [Podosphaera aphanis]
MKGLPLEILSMVFDHLEHQRDFRTLFAIALTGKFLGPKAARSLYRIHEYSTIFNQPDPFKEEFGYDNKESQVVLIKFRDLIFPKRNRFWKSIILSSLGQTMFPYCLYIRSLNLDVLELDIYHHIPRPFAPLDSLSIENMFHILNTSSSRDGSMIVRQQETVELIVDCLFRFSCKESGARVNIESLKWKKMIPGRWISQVSNLRTLVTSGLLDLEVAKLISQSCPRFHTLVSNDYDFESYNRETKTQIVDRCVTFLNQLKKNTLRKLIIPDISAGNEIIRSLNRQAESLKALRIEFISPNATKNLHHLNVHQTLTSLQLHFERWTMGETLKYRWRNNGLFQTMVDWICSCQNLRELLLVEPVNGTAIVTQVCRKDLIRLQKLELFYTSTEIDDKEDFLRALSTQTMLEYLSLDLECSTERYHLVDDSNYISFLGRLVNLKSLVLPPNYGTYCEKKIIDLVSHLPKLAALTFECRFSTDLIWPTLAGLKYLKYLKILAISCSFTFNWILGFVYALYHNSNEGLGLYIMPGHLSTFKMTDEQNIVISRLLSRRVGGWIEITNWDTRDELDEHSEYGERSEHSERSELSEHSAW